MNVSMAVHASPRKKSIFLSISRAKKRVEIGVRPACMPSRIMAALAKERRLSCQKPVMVTAVDFVAEQTVLRYGRMLERKGPSLFGVALVTEIVYRIGLDHCLNVESPHRIVAA